MKILIKTFLIFLLFLNFTVRANDIAAMSGISEAAGNSAQAAADQLAADAGKVAENISGVNFFAFFFFFFLFFLYAT